MSTLSWFAVPDLTTTFQNATPLWQAVSKLIANLKWNSSMTVGLALWGLLIGARESLPGSRTTLRQRFWVSARRRCAVSSFFCVFAPALCLKTFFPSSIVQIKSAQQRTLVRIGFGSPQ